MGMHLIAAGFWLADPQNWLVVLQVALGLGFVIFVHELGHFAVAKMCGVKCEKFYLGFDIYGLKLFKKQWGETEYGIGILPLGGYVKMLGQDDNPTKTQSEMDRSRAAAQNAEHHGAGGGDLPPEPTAETPPVHDPRSYLAQSVPERMAIISAGVIMNLIFAVIMASIAYGMGVPEPPAKITDLSPGEAAWTAGLQPGDRITQIDDIKNPRYRDLFASVALADLEEGVRFTVDRPGRDETFDLTIYPEQHEDRLKPTIGVPPPFSTIISTEAANYEWSPIGKAGKFKTGDRIVKFGDHPVEGYADLMKAQLKHAAQPAPVTVARDSDSEGGEKTEVTIELPANPFKHLGVVMEMGPIAAVQAGSPAEKAGVKPGDKIVSINGQPPVDPFFLPHWLRSESEQGGELQITVARGSEEIPLTVTPREANWFTTFWTEGSKIDLPTLGIAYPITSKIREVLPDSPAAAHSELAVGEIIVKADFDHDDEKYAELMKNSVSFETNPNWAFFMAALQDMPPGTQITLVTKSGKSVDLTPVASDEWFNPDRGFTTMVDQEVRTATSFGEAVALGARETWESATQVFQFLGALVTNRLSPKLLGGPATIAAAAAGSAEHGVASLLMFLTMLSANLAVINFMPIPILDGGHMVFLTLEGIRGKPVSERVVVLLTYVGFAMVLTLMVFVIGLDITRFWPF